jgi:hypothetical protein
VENRRFSTGYQLFVTILSISGLMPYIIGVLLLIGLIYYLWPYLLLGLACIAGYRWYLKICRNKNLREVSKSVPILQERLVGLYCIKHGDSLEFSRITDIVISSKCLPSLSGSESLNLRIDTISKVGSSLTDRNLQYVLRSDEMGVMVIDSLPSDYGFDVLWHLVMAFLDGNGLEIVPPDSLDSKVCSIIFGNYPEAEWAEQAITKVESCIAPIERAYGASLTNELLSGNSKSLKRSLDVFERERREIAEYMKETTISIDKCVEFLSIPEALRGFSEYDVSTLEIFSRKREMREAFEEVLSIKQEYDRLKGVSPL